MRYRVSYSDYAIEEPLLSTGNEANMKEVGSGTYAYSFSSEIELHSFIDREKHIHPYRIFMIKRDYRTDDEIESDVRRT